MIVWGGFNGTTSLGDGARYNPVANAWTALPTSVAPAARYAHTTVWTGTDMIVWGGLGSSSAALGDGVRYSPAGNAWTALSSAGAPSPRGSHTAVWTGTEMIVWGGTNGSYLSDTFSYTPGRVMFLYLRP